MEWLDKMMDAINYMENNMEGKIDIEEVARVAYSSTFHFQRMFHMVTGFTVAEYIRNRRLTLAAHELATDSEVRVIDIALKYGYDSPEAFTKAFRKAHGITPSAARKTGINLKAFPRISFHLQLKGEKDMDYKIVQKDAFKIIGKALRVQTGDGENYKKIPKFWCKCCEDGTCDEVCSLSKDQILLGVCCDFDQEKEQFTYMIAAEYDGKSNKAEFDVKEVPAATWAVFTAIGPTPTAIQELTTRIFQEWFPATGFEHADAPELEVYLPGDPNAEDYKCEVWMPIVKK